MSVFVLAREAEPGTYTLPNPPGFVSAGVFASESAATTAAASNNQSEVVPPGFDGPWRVLPLTFTT